MNKRSRILWEWPSIDDDQPNMLRASLIGRKWLASVCVVCVCVCASWSEPHALRKYEPILQALTPTLLALFCFAFMYMYMYIYIYIYIMTADDEVGLLNEQIIAPNCRLVAALVWVSAASKGQFACSIDRAHRSSSTGHNLLCRPSTVHQSLRSIGFWFLFGSLWQNTIWYICSLPPGISISAYSQNFSHCWKLVMVQLIGVHLKI